MRPSLALALSAALLCSGTATLNAGIFIPGRVYTFKIDIEGEPAGVVTKIDGGIRDEDTADIDAAARRGDPANIDDGAENDVGVSTYQKKNLATISHEPLTLEVGPGMGASFWDYIQESWSQEGVRRNMELHSVDADQQI